MDVADFANLAFDCGIWPVAGGTVDQANWFLQAAKFCKNDVEKWKDVRVQRQMKRRR